MRVDLSGGQLEIRKCDGVKVVIGKRDKPKPEAPQLDNLFYY
jgi:hypothetical protein